MILKRGSCPESQSDSPLPLKMLSPKDTGHADVFSVCATKHTGHDDELSDSMQRLTLNNSPKFVVGEATGNKQSAKSPGGDGSVKDDVEPSQSENINHYVDPVCNLCGVKFTDASPFPADYKYGKYYPWGRYGRDQDETGPIRYPIGHYCAPCRYTFEKHGFKHKTLMSIQEYSRAIRIGGSRHALGHQN